MSDSKSTSPQEAVASALMAVTQAEPALAAYAAEDLAAAVAEIAAANPDASPQEILAAATVEALKAIGTDPAAVRSAIDLVLTDLAADPSRPAMARSAVVEQFVTQLQSAGRWPWLVGRLKTVLTEAALASGPAKPDAAATKPDEYDPAVIVVGPADPSGGDPPDDVLAVGSAGSAAAELQTHLRDAGFDPGDIDGVYGELTEAAVRSFQAAAGIDVDGIAGPQTWGALWAI